MIEFKTPARVCFFGDHQDYLDLPVIAGTINRYIHLKATPNNEGIYNVYLPDIEENRVIHLNNKTTQIERDDYFLSGIKVLEQKGAHFAQGYNITISGNIPVNAGLSSSSALVVAWIRFLIQAQKDPIQYSDLEVGQLTYTTEVLFFDQPGGLMDQYTIAQGGLLYIDTKTTDCTALPGKLGPLVVAESGIAKQTLSILKKGRIYGQEAIKAINNKYPDFNIQSIHVDDYERYKNDVPKDYLPYWYAAVHNYDITLKAKKVLESKGSTEELGFLMNSYQKILEEYILNTPKPMMKMMQNARENGAMGTKIIGSGGGGCMVAMVNEESKENVINAFLASGAKAAYEVQLTYNSND